MSDMRLIKRSGSKLSVSDKAYVIFHSCDKGGLMGRLSRKKCFFCHGAFVCRQPYWSVDVIVSDDRDGPTRELRVDVCDSCFARYKESKGGVEIDGDGARF